MLELACALLRPHDLLLPIGAEPLFVANTVLPQEKLGSNTQCWGKAGRQAGRQAERQAGMF